MEVFYEIGVKIGHILWRKLVLDETERADKSLSNIAYELIVEQDYKLSSDILEFAVSMPKLSDLYKKMMTVNLANCYKLLGRNSESQKLLAGIDWRASGLEFQVSVAAVLDQYADAASLMKQIGANGEVSKSDYQNWPAFIGFRKSAEFLEAYRKVFRTEYRDEEMKIRRFYKPNTE